MVRTGPALALGLALAGCGQPTIAWQQAASPDRRYIATAEYDAPVLDRKDTYVFLQSGQPFTREAVYQSHQHDCVVLRWTGPRALTISHLSGVPIKRAPEWKPRWGGEPVKISYRDFSLIGLALPPECMVME
jgi:hypothetical protein